MRAMIRACVLVSLATLATAASACAAFDGVEAGIDRAVNGTGSAKDDPTNGLTDEPMDGATDEAAAPVASAPASAPAPASVAPAPAPAPAPVLSVTLGAKFYSLVVGGTSSVRGDFTWNATGSKAARVTVQMKSTQSMTWTDILTDQPASDVGSYYLPTYVQQSFWFRAVAVDPAFPESSTTSEILFVQ